MIRLKDKVDFYFDTPVRNRGDIRRRVTRLYCENSEPIECTINVSFPSDEAAVSGWRRSAGT